jgi:hypothetical protein
VIAEGHHLHLSPRLMLCLLLGSLRGISLATRTARSARKSSSWDQKPERCHANIYTTQIAYFLGWNNTIPALFADMSCQHRALLVLAAHGQDQPTKITAQAAQVAVREPVGVRGEGTRSRSYGLFAHQVLALVLIRLVWFTRLEFTILFY